ncbi:MAG: hypothetical protein GXO19_00490, partial [Epsilonproteobacteria bacterium]|nr:hypothetical protein [Campylobacterota bacterium]NPA56190.1 hypothetical protein [Campylobacterota bacterium]
MNRQELQSLRELYFRITEKRGRPLDFWEVAALLEVYGIRDIDARKEYGFSSVFELAQFLYTHFVDEREYPERRLTAREEIPPL